MSQADAVKQAANAKPKKTRKSAELPTEIKGVKISEMSADSLFDGLKQRREELAKIPDVSKIKLEVRAIEAQLSQRMSGK